MIFVSRKAKIAENVLDKKTFTAAISANDIAALVLKLLKVEKQKQIFPIDRTYLLLFSLCFDFCKQKSKNVYIQRVPSITVALILHFLQLKKQNN